MEGDINIVSMFSECGDGSFYIDKYQRPIKYTSKNVSNILRTINSRSFNKSTKYNMGFIVFDTSRKDKISVVNGQQRMTTFFTLACAALKYIEDNDITSRKIVHRIENIIGIDCPSIMSSKSDDQEAIKAIWNYTIHQSQENSDILNGMQHILCKNFRWCMKFFREHTQDEFSHLWDNILDKLTFSVHKTDDEDECWRIFNGINSYKLELEPHESIPSIIYETISTFNKENQIECQSIFEDIDDYITKDLKSYKDKRAFYQRFLFLKCGIYPTHKKIVETFSDLINNKDVMDNPVEFFRDMLSLTKNVENTFNDRCKMSLFIKDKVISNIPAMRLAIDVVFPQFNNIHESLIHINKLSNDKKVYIINKIQNFILTKYICGQRVVSDISVFGDLLKTIDSSVSKSFDIEKMDNVFHDFVFSRGMPSKDSLILNLREMNLYGKDYCLFLLKKVNSIMSNDNDPIMDSNSISIDHIMCQDKNENNKLLHTIGNLTLVSGIQNSEFQTKSYEEKKNTYIMSNIPMNRYFSGVSKWDDDEITKRTDIMVKLLADNLYTF